MQYVLSVIFGLIWSTGVLFFDGTLARESFRQFASRNYAVTTGTVTHSELKRHRGSKGGTSYEAIINYRFKIGGHSYYGDRLRYNESNSSDANFASGIVDARPVGATVPVYYDPKNPRDSLLFPGIDGSDFMPVLFLTPFNAVMLGFWMWMGGWLRQRLLRPTAGGVKIIVTPGMRTRVRLPLFGAAPVAVATTGVFGFIATFIVGFSTHMRPSLGFILTAIAVVYMAGVGVYLWRWQKLQSGTNDLVINLAARTLDLPQTYGRKQPLTVNIADIESLFVDKVTHTSSKGGTSYSYAPSLSLRGPNAGIQKLADWSDKAKAKNFADWLRNQLGC